MEIGLLKRLVDDIIRLCDRLDDIGLVDYELGVWEEEIVSGKFSTGLHFIQKSSITKLILFSIDRLHPDTRRRAAGLTIEETIQNAIQVSSVIIVHVPFQA